MLEIIRAGIFDSVQDLGRFGFRSLGVAVSGAMHQKAFAHANSRLANHPNDAALEIGQIGGGKRKPNGKLDVAMIQSLARRDEVNDLEPVERALRTLAHRECLGEREKALRCRDAVGDRSGLVADAESLADRGIARGDLPHEPTRGRALLLLPKGTVARLNGAR